MSYLLGGTVGYLLGLVVALVVMWRVNRRLLLRLTARGGLVTTILDLENRRQAYDSGRDVAVRDKAGAPARIVDTMPVRPGTLAQRYGVSYDA